MTELPRLDKRLRHIVVEGPIGAGKTMLARRLADTLEYELYLERPEENPFLPRFYADPRNVALPVQLYFLFQRVRDVRPMQQRDIFKTGYVADFMLEKDQLFARINLDDDEYALYQQVYSRLHTVAPIPDMVIYLQASIDRLFERVMRRGVGYESVITRDYLRRINDAYVEFFHHYHKAPLLIVNTDTLDLAAGDEEYRMLLEQMRLHRQGRRYFNSIDGP